MKIKTKRIIAAILGAIIGITGAIILASCGNMSIGLGNYSFKKVHILTYSGNDIDLTIEKWYESGNGIEVYTSECGSIFLSEGCYILCEDRCPICDKEKKQ